MSKYTKLFNYLKDQGIIDGSVAHSLTDIDEIFSVGLAVYSPLLKAIKDQNLEAVGKLIEHGASLELGNNFNKTPLHFAAFSGNVDIIQLLEPLVSDVTKTNNFGENVLHYLIRSKKPEALKLFVDNPKYSQLWTQPNMYGKTPLDEALVMPEMLEVLEQSKIPLPSGAPPHQSYNLAQINLISKLTEYLKLTGCATPGDFLESKGNCSGFSFIHGKMTAQGKEEDFFNMLRVIAQWDGTKETLESPIRISPLDRQYGILKQFMEAFINELIWYQHSTKSIADIYNTDTGKLGEKQAKSHVIYDAISSKDELSIQEILNFQTDVANDFSFTMNMEQLTEYLEIFKGFPDTWVNVAGGQHATSIYVDSEGMYHYYDPNHRFKLPPIKEPDQLAQSIFEYKYNLLGMSDKSEINIRFSNYQYSDKSKPKAELYSNVPYPYPNNQHKASPNGFTELHWAVMHHDVDRIKDLLESGKVNLEQKDKLGFTPFMRAAQMGLYDVTELMLKTAPDQIMLPKGFDPLNNREEPHEFNLIFQNPKLSEQFAKYYDSNKLYQYICKQSSLISNPTAGPAMASLLEIFIEQNPNFSIDTKLSDSGESLFMIMLRSFNLYTKVEISMFNKALKQDPQLFNKLDGFDANPLQLVAECKDPSCWRHMYDSLSRQGQVNKKDSRGNTLLHYAVKENNLNLVKFLISQGVDCEVKNAQGFDALSLAKKDENLKLIHALELPLTLRKQRQAAIMTKLKNENLKAQLPENQTLSEASLDFLNQHYSEATNQVVKPGPDNPLERPVLFDEQGNIIVLFESISFGRGRFGDVCLGVNLETKDTFAVKIQDFNRSSQMRVYSNLSHDEYESMVKPIKDRFGRSVQKEANNLAKIDSLISQVCPEYSNRQYLVEPIIPGIDLNQVLTQLKSSEDSNPDVSELISIAIELCKVVQDFHARGFIHRDLHDGNLKWDPELKKMQLLDMGHAVELKSAKTYEGAREGNLMNMAPEILRQQSTKAKYSTGTDNYAVGMILAMIFTEQSPKAIKQQFNQSISDVKDQSQYADLVKAQMKDIFDVANTPKDPIQAEIFNLIRRLASPIPNARPELEEILIKLKKLKISIKVKAENKIPKQQSPDSLEGGSLAYEEPLGEEPYSNYINEEIQYQETSSSDPYTSSDQPEPYATLDNYIMNEDDTPYSESSATEQDYGNTLYSDVADEIPDDDISPYASVSEFESNEADIQATTHAINEDNILSSEVGNTEQDDDKTLYSDVANEIPEIDISPYASVSEFESNEADIQLTTHALNSSQRQDPSQNLSEQILENLLELENVSNTLKSQNLKSSSKGLTFARQTQKNQAKDNVVELLIDIQRQLKELSQDVTKLSSEEINTKISNLMDSIDEQLSKSPSSKPLQTAKDVIQKLDRAANQESKQGFKSIK